MWSSLTHPEYADSAAVFDALVAPNVLTYVAQGEAFVDEAYSAKNFRIANIRESGERRKRAHRSEIPIGRTALDASHLAYSAYRVSLTVSSILLQAPEIFSSVHGVGTHRVHCGPSQAE